MADNDAKPMTDGDITPPPATTDFEPAAPLKDAGVEFEPTAGTGSAGDRAAATGIDGSDTGDAASKTEQAKQAFKDASTKYGAQAGDRIRTLADTGKARAGDALGQLSQLLDDAAGQVDEKLGAQYGGYARQAAGAVSGFSDQIKAKDVDELLDDARAFVRASPAVAIGAAAAVGFVVARLIQSGIDTGRDA